MNDPVLSKSKFWKEEHANLGKQYKELKNWSLGEKNRLEATIKEQNFQLQCFRAQLLAFAEKNSPGQKPPVPIWDPDEKMLEKIDFLSEENM